MGHAIPEWVNALAGSVEGMLGGRQKREAESPEPELRTTFTTVADVEPLGEPGPDVGPREQGLQCGEVMFLTKSKHSPNVARNP